MSINNMLATDDTPRAMDTWPKWFAWRPVRCLDDKLRWLVTVEWNLFPQLRSHSRGLYTWWVPVYRAADQKEGE